MHSRWISSAFFLSGAAALVYQVAWQRSLLTLYGSDTELTTIVVAAFLLGLGLGSLLGGQLSRAPGNLPLLLFGAGELGICAFAAFSPALFRWVGSVTLGASLFQTAVLSFSLLLVPTVLMGATLPLLTEYAVRRSGRVGHSLGRLYFSNTLGGACGAFASPVLLALAGLQRAVSCTAGVNLLAGAVAIGVFTALRRTA